MSNRDVVGPLDASVEDLTASPFRANEILSLLDILVDLGYHVVDVFLVPLLLLA